MNNNEMIADFLNHVVAGNADAAKEAFSLYCNNKAKHLGVVEKVMERVEQFKTALLEYGVNYNAQSINGHGGSLSGGQSTPTSQPRAKHKEESPLRMEGDKILVNNKQVGHITYDIEDFEGGINFVSEDGTFSKEFNSAEELFSFLSTKFLGDGNV